MTTTKKILISFLFLLGYHLSVFAQEQPLKDFAEERKEMKFCFYPSTLRMINLAHNPDFDELVSGIDKLLVYSLDSAAKADKSYREVINEYRSLGFEELTSVYGGDLNLFIYGKNRKRENEYMGIISQDDKLTAFYLRGNIAFGKIPRLFQSLKSGDVINPFDFNLNDFGNNTQDQ